MLALLNSLCDLHPLLLGRVNTSWVVCAGVEKNDATLGHVLDILDHTIEVEANSVLVVVPVLLNLQARVFEDGIVVCPRGRWDVDGLSTRVEAFQESTTNAQSASAGDGLGDGNATVLDRR